MCTNLFCWNVRGFNISSHRRGFKYWLKNNNNLFGGIIETHVKQMKCNKLISQTLPGWLYETNYEFSELGKIWVVWHPSVKVVVIKKSLQMITCEVLLPDATSWILVSVVYAANFEDTRLQLWHEIEEVSVYNCNRLAPWIVLGDFNQTRHPNEHSTAETQNIDRKTREFRECLLSAGLDDLNYRGNLYTWWNKNPVKPVAKKLDRILVNELWEETFPSAYGFFGEHDFSDHAPCSVVLQLDSQKKKSSFKFYNFLLQNEEFFPMICYHWFSFNVVGSAMFRLARKLKLLKKEIRAFSRLNYSGIEMRVKEAHEILISHQAETLADPSPVNAALELEAQRKWLLLIKAEEKFFLQRSRVLWLVNGDCNTAYFHRMVNARRAINHIHFLTSIDGVRYETQSGMMNHCIDYFSELLGGPCDPQLFTQGDVNILLPFQCSENQRNAMTMRFTRLEIRNAFFSLPRNKTSGPDGYSAEFFCGCWEIVGPEVCDAIEEFFISGSMLKQWNTTTMVLIPKITNAASTSDFRPISCLNTIYKVISKLLASRLLPLLTQVISSAQSAFLPGRLLGENVLLATDLVNGYNRQSSEPKAMLKVDLRKAFDSVRWDFVLAALTALGIPQQFVNWISECISTASFTIAFNGTTGGNFKSSKGLRQGDPLSPYLFVLAMEVFSSLLQSRFDSGYIHYHPRASDLKLSHLMFADDVMIFFDGGSSSLHGVSEALEDFASWSGLKINPQKSQLFCAGVNEMEATAMSHYGFSTGILPVRYLGLPLMSRKLRINEYEPLLDALVRRFRAWAVRALSFAGRVQLLNTVIAGTLNFWMSTFLLPKGCIQKIESLCSRFLWSGDVDRTGQAKVAWETVCLPRSEGGLGLRRLSNWNTTLCLRYIWLLFSDKPSLWADWHRHHNMSSESFWTIQHADSDSWAWKSLLKLRPLARQYIVCDVGNGSRAKFWVDTWTPLGPLINLLGVSGPRRLRLPMNSTVAQACSSTGWRLPSPRSDAEVQLHAHLTLVALPSQSSVEDSYSWLTNGIRNKDYSASKTWNDCRPRDTEKDWAKLIWFKGRVPKHAFNMWTAHLNRLPTRVRLAAWNPGISPSCTLCLFGQETRDHIMLTCGFSSELWRTVLQRLSYSQPGFLDWNELLSWIKRSSPRAPSLLRKIVAQATVHHIWRQRNDTLHNQSFNPASVVFRMIDREIKLIILGRRGNRNFKFLLSKWLS